MLNRRQFMFGSAGTLALGGCASSPMASFTQDNLDIAYVNGVIWTGNIGAPLAGALGITGNKISHVGEDSVNAAKGRKTRIVDLQGSFVAPGMIDNHTHFLLASQSLTQINLRQANTPQVFSSLLGQKAKTLAPGKWILGGNWDEQLWGGELPKHQWIDSLTPNNPVAVARLDLHSLFLNALALKLAGIDKNTQDPAGGVIVRDSNGHPTGVLKDTARDLVLNIIPQPTIHEKQQTYKAGIEHGLSFGVTQAHVKAITWEDHEVMMSMRGKGEPGIRFSSFVPIQDWQKLVEQIKQEGYGDDWIRWGGVKGVFDGSLGAGTAWFKRPYTDEPDNSGLAFQDTENLRHWIKQCDRYNLHVAVHAIGDHANEQLLNIYAETIAENGKRDRRFLIEHAQHLYPGLYQRFNELDVIASMQPYHAVDDGRWAVNRIGQERLRGTYAFASLLKARAKVSFGSDWPVAPLDPRKGLQAAVLRQTIDGKNPQGWMPEEKVSIEQALYAYTGMNAYAGFQEHKLGKILPGYLADFVVYENNLLSVDPEKIKDTKILQTVVNGVQRYGIEM